MLAMQARVAEVVPLFKVYFYNPRLWLLAFILASMLEHTTRCGDAYR
jgi:hypothetical protein